MPTQKVFKGRVRARMSKTGESYTAARQQLIRKAGDPSPTEPDPALFGVPDESMIRRTGRGHAEWFALLDEWGGTSHTHTEIARWLSSEHGVPGWWTQSITVSYERARGMRARHEMADGYSVSATRSVAALPEHALAAFADATSREAWLPAAPLTPRPTRAARTARFDWQDPPSRVVVTVTPRDGGKTAVTVTHEQIKDAGDAARLKARWRTWLGDLKVFLERS
jgi:hypothetical protein